MKIAKNIDFYKNPKKHINYVADSNGAPKSQNRPTPKSTFAILTIFHSFLVISQHLQKHPNLPPKHHQNTPKICPYIP